jgi:signal transduction histidine kinase
LAGEPHVRALVEYARGYFDNSDVRWSEHLEARVARATEPEARSGRRERTDGSMIDWAQLPLPDGASLFTFLDVTDSIRVERALLERNEALETADRLKSEFVANISYELRTPLNAIVGFAEILENQFFGPLNERQIEYSHGIVEASQRLTALINDILDLATIEAGYMRLDVAPVDIRALLDNLQTVSHERAYNRNISLKVDCPEDIGSLMGDGRRLRQALYNLLSNAFKFTPEGGTVTVSARRDEAEMALVVADTGAGMRTEDLARVFGKFERGTGQGRQNGAGLGLSLVKSLIELHGGWVELDSALKEGTRVTCHIPLEQPIQQPKTDGQPKTGEEPLRA